MKTTAKIIAYCIWFGLTLWLSFWFLHLVGWIDNRTGIFSPDIRFWIFLITWFGFVLLLAWLPIWLTKNRFPNFARLMAKVAVFFMMLLACTISCEAIWDNFLAGNIYNCTDDNLGGFLRPGDWVQNPVTVPKVVLDSVMSNPDTIKQGWSIPKLWFLWWLFVAASVAISLSFPLLIFRSRKSKNAQTISS
jgi:hypothetical protein